MDKKDDLDLFGDESEQHTQGQFGGFGDVGGSFNDAFSDIDMGEVKERKPLNKKKVVSSILAGVLLLGGGTGGYLYWNKEHKSKLATQSAKGVEKRG